jgi:hypothetical protein
MEESCEEVWAEGLRFEWEDKWDSPYKDALNCSIRTHGGEFVSIKPPADKSQLTAFLSGLRMYDSTNLTDGIFTWMFYNTSENPTIRFAASKVESEFELGTAHKVMGLRLRAAKVYGAGELKKESGTITYNLESGSYMKPWKESREKKRYCMPEEIETKVDTVFLTLFPGAVKREGTFISKMRVSNELLEEYRAAGFIVDVQPDRVTCRTRLRGGRRRNRRKTMKKQKDKKRMIH